MHIEAKIRQTRAACWIAALMALTASPAAFALDAAAPAGPRMLAETFNRALAKGDAAAVREMLLPNVLIYESGGVEASAAEYASHHLPADMAFMANLKREQLSQESGGEGASAWVATRSRLSGRFKDKEVDLDSTETLVMTQTKAGWRIAHVHWSSAPHRNAP